MHRAYVYEVFISWKSNPVGSNIWIHNSIQKCDKVLPILRALPWRT